MILSEPVEKAFSANALDRFIKENEPVLVEDTMRLSRIPSVKTDPTPGHPYGDRIAEALDLALSMAKIAGFETKNCDYRYGSCVLAGTEGIGSLAMAAHLDVVPADPEGWTRPPFEPWVRDGYIIGRGATDNKGSAAAALQVMRFFKENGIRLRHDLRLIFGCDEECGSSDMVYLTETDRDVPKFVLVPDGPFPVCHAEKGRIEVKAAVPLHGSILALRAGEAPNSTPAFAEAILAVPEGFDAASLRLPDGVKAFPDENGTLRLTAHGVPRHTGNPAGAVDALHLVAQAALESALANEADARILEGLSRLSGDHLGAGFGIACDHGPLGTVTCSCSVVRTENRVLTVLCDLRYPANANFDELNPRILSSLKECGFEPVSIKNDAPNYFPADDALIQKLASIANERTGSALGPVAMTGGTYARKFPRAVAYGPSRPDIRKPFPDGHGWAHQIDEAVRIENLTDMIAVYVRALIMLDTII